MDRTSPSNPFGVEMEQFVSPIGNGVALFNRFLLEPTTGTDIGGRAFPNLGGCGLVRRSKRSSQTPPSQFLPWLHDYSLYTGAIISTMGRGRSRMVVLRILHHGKWYDLETRSKSDNTTLFDRIRPPEGMTY